MVENFHLPTLLAIRGLALASTSTYANTDFLDNQKNQLLPRLLLF